MPTNVQTVSQCTRPVFFENADKRYRYSRTGTSFVARFRGHIYVVTANHCLTNFKLDQTRIQYASNSRDFLPFDFVSRLSPSNPATILKGKLQPTDVAIFHVAKDKLSPRLASTISTLDFDQLMVSPPTPVKTYPIWTAGYPSSLNDIDPAKRKIRTRSYLVEADYQDNAIVPLCHRCDLIKTHKIPSLDGMSGAPVFQYFPPQPPAKARYAFVGMVLCEPNPGWTDGAQFYFVDSSVIFHSILNISRMIKPLTTAETLKFHSPARIFTIQIDNTPRQA